MLQRISLKKRGRGRERKKEREKKKHGVTKLLQGPKALFFKRYFFIPCLIHRGK